MIVPASRVAKTVANKNAVWHGAAPTGPKQKDPLTSEPVKQSRKRAASKGQESAKVKARKKDAKATLDPDTEDSVMEAVPMGLKAKFFDDDDAESDGDDQDVDQELEDNGEDNDDDLLHLQAAGDSEGLKKVLDEERPRWTSADLAAAAELAAHDDSGHLHFRTIGHSRTSSHASVSSGHISVPASRASSESDDSEDEETTAGLSSLKKAQQLVSDNDKKFAEISSRAVAKPLPPKARSKRDVARDQERPTWNEPVAPIKKKNVGSLATASSRSIKLEDTTRPLRRQPQAGVKREVVDDDLRSSSPSIINVDDSDDSDSDVEVVSRDIAVVVRSDGKIKLKSQSPRVEKTAQLAVDFFLGYYIFKYAFPSTEEKRRFGLDALLNSAHTLLYEDIKQKLLTDSVYCDLLSTVLHGRVSAFRLRPKTAADMNVVTNYALGKHTEERVAFLLVGMRYIHSLLPGAIDPKTAKPGPDVIKKDSSYMSEGIRTTLSNAYFKGTPSLAEKYSTLFVTAENGRKQLPASMVALAGTAVHASLNEYRTGHHIPSKFEGNHLQEIYDTHLLLIDMLLKAGSTVLEDLYELLTRGSRLAEISSRPMAMEAIALLGL
ncbi:hypothetical protein B0H19DRAFT_1257481 [Mycena capillaripes]|nr:hypothetical protein B0H19DRAFT_1272132 [Mycena capillaripes]KAJ6566217.1 hypothetical protein B0H19DRAFT_1257481 [Mycena capillaripes]